MDTFKEKIIEITRETVESNGFFLIDFVLRGNPKNKVIEIYVDGEQNVTADDCAGLSRQINEKIEAGNIIETAYRLDVSSPGVDRPLIYLKQYPKHLNRKFEVSYTLNEEKKKFTGTLLRIDGDNLVFQVNKSDELTVNFNNITKAKVIVSFS